MNIRKRVMCLLLALCMALTLLPVNALAGGGAATELDIHDGSIVITEDGYTQGAGVATPYKGDYAITQTSNSTAHTITVKSGATANVTISGVNITANSAPAIKVENGATLNLTLGGENSVTGGAGYAGISVEAAFDNYSGQYLPGQSGKVVINGTGSLTAQGGAAIGSGNNVNSCGGGAGIGGDGIGLYETENPASPDTSNLTGGDFGTIEIKGGTVTAIGGAHTETPNYAGAGAGIGGGGIYLGNVPNIATWPYAGVIKITGGTVEAIGHDESSAFFSSAGIGSGNCSGYAYSVDEDGNKKPDSYTQNTSLYATAEDLSIYIGGSAAVTATGGAGAAGIGGSVNGSSGPITIGGDAVVQASGKAYGQWGGAGIGSGDNGYSEPIVIEGNAKVTAEGSGYAAGIGGGGNGGGGATEITIQGNADVTAFSDYGAGIGGACADAWYPAANCGTVTLDSAGTIIAYGGPSAQTIGVGYPEPQTSNNKLIVGENTGEVWMFTNSNTTKAFLGQDGSENAFFIAPGKAAIWYSHNGDAASFPDFDQAASSDQAEYAWTNENGILTITSGGEDMASHAYKSGYILHNWAYFGNGAATDPMVIGIEVTKQPNLIYSEGDPLDLFALEVTVTYDNDSTATLRYDDSLLAFSVGGISIAHGDLLTEADHHGTAITVTYQEHTAQTEALTVTAKQLDEPTSPSVTRYTITASAGEGGSVSPSGSVLVRQEADKTFIITPDEGYKIVDVLVDGVSMGPIDRYTFENIRESHSIEIVFGEGAAPVDPGISGVGEWLDSEDHREYLNGYPGDEFRPDNNMTRAEVAQMFYNLLLDQEVEISVSFADVAEDAWYSTAVNTLASLEILGGVGGERFEPERAITRAEFTAIAMRFAQAAAAGENRFSDIDDNSWYADAVIGAVEYGWISGYPDGSFRPERSISRAEVTAIVNRMLGRIADRSYVRGHLAELTLFADVTEQHWGYYDIIEATNGHDYQENGNSEQWLQLR